MTATTKRTFEEWMALVDAAVQSRTGMSADDLPDCCYRDWYDDGLSPKQAAIRAIKAATND